MLADPDATTVALQSGSGRRRRRWRVGSARRRRSRPAPPGKSYQAWVIDGKTPRCAGLSDATDGRAIVSRTKPVPRRCDGRGDARGAEGELADATDGRGGRSGLSPRAPGGVPHSAAATRFVACRGRAPVRPIRTVHLFAWTTSAPLFRLFGFDGFRPGQAEVVAARVAGRDTLALMPTGSGKSLPTSWRRCCDPGRRSSSRR